MTVCVYEPAAAETPISADALTHIYISSHFLRGPHLLQELVEGLHSAANKNNREHAPSVVCKINTKYNRNEIIMITTKPTAAACIGSSGRGSSCPIAFPATGYGALWLVTLSRSAGAGALAAPPIPPPSPCCFLESPKNFARPDICPEAPPLPPCRPRAAVPIEYADTREMEGPSCVFAVAGNFFVLHSRHKHAPFKRNSFKAHINRKDGYERNTSRLLSRPNVAETCQRPAPSTHLRCVGTKAIAAFKSEASASLLSVCCFFAGVGGVRCCGGLFCTLVSPAAPGDGCEGGGPCCVWGGTRCCSGCCCCCCICCM